MSACRIDVIASYPMRLVDAQVAASGTGFVRKYFKNKIEKITDM